VDRLPAARLRSHTLLRKLTLHSALLKERLMSDVISTLFNDYDRGRISRRRLLQALGVVMAAGPMSTLARAQGQCADRGRAGDPACDTTPAKLPFDPTGWKTVCLDRFYLQVPDYQKEAAFFHALMNWDLRSDDGQQALLDVGDWGGFMIRGGYVAPPPPAPRAAAPPAGADAGAAGAAGAAAGGGAAGAAGGRGGGRGGAGGGGQRGPRMAVDGFCWGIEPWDAKKVEAALKARGLDPVADNSKDFESFHVKDPDGFNLQISNGTVKKRHATKATAKLNAPAPFESTNWKTIWLDHISFQVTNYKESTAFYQALLGWKPGTDEGSQNQCEIGDVGGVIIRGRSGILVPGAPAPATPVTRHASIDHIAFGITPWDIDTVRAELEKRSLSIQVDSGNSKGPDTAAAEKAMEAKLGHPLTNQDKQVADMHDAAYQSYHTNTPNGFNLQISYVTKDKRNAGATAPTGRGGGGGTTWF
jgi:catechol 2,3-dioxygenase-like lactoylglutathione lyase family enzyme